jgi:hypothetical protein
MRKIISRRKNPNISEEAQEKEFFIHHIEINLREIKKILDSIKDKLTLQDVTEVQRLTGKAHRIIKDIDVSIKLGLPNYYNW